MFDILAFMLENCQQTEVMKDAQGVARKLSEAGFDEADISTALSWLAGATREPKASPMQQLPRDAARRVLATREAAKLDTDSHGFLLRLEGCGILDPDSRERLLERIVAAPVETLSLDQVRLVALIVLWRRGQPSGPLLTEEVFFVEEAHSLS